VVRSLVDSHDDDPSYRPIQWLLAGGFGERLLSTLGDICDREFGLDTRHPDLLIVDLALSSWQTTSLTLESPSDKHPSNALRFPDPREALQKTTGFCLLEAVASPYYRRTERNWEPIPVIAMSYSRNPLVAQHCLENRAAAFVRKPFDEKEVYKFAGTYYLNDEGFDLDRIETVATDKCGRMEVEIFHFLTSVAADVLRAMAGVVARRISDHVPSQLAHDLVFSRGELEPVRRPGTAVSLIAVPWLDPLLRTLADDTSASLSFASAVWSVVVSELEQHAAEIDYLLGATALAFHDLAATDVEHAAALARCIAPLPALFGPGGSARADLIERLDQLVHDELLESDECAAIEDRIRSFIDGDPLALHVIAAWAPNSESLFGVVETSRRSYHTTLATTPHWLAAVLDIQKDPAGGPPPALVALQREVDPPQVPDLSFDLVTSPGSDGSPLDREFDLYRVVPAP
jgi:CheY-like chemotaxis protein